MVDPEHDLDVCAGDDEPVTRSRRRWLGIHFECCGAYARIYRNKEGSAYVGNCPRCGVRVEVPIGPHGTNNRFFRAY